MTSFAHMTSGVNPMEPADIQQKKSQDLNDLKQEEVKLSDTLASRRPTAQKVIKNRPITQKARKMANSIEKNAKNNVNIIKFHPAKKTNPKIAAGGNSAAMQSFVDSEIDTSVAANEAAIQLPLGKLKQQQAKGYQAALASGGSDYGSVSTIHHRYEQQHPTHH